MNFMVAGTVHKLYTILCPYIEYRVGTHSSKIQVKKLFCIPSHVNIALVYGKQTRVFYSRNTHLQTYNEYILRELYLHIYRRVPSTHNKTIKYIINTNYPLAIQSSGPQSTLAVHYIHIIHVPVFSSQGRLTHHHHRTLYHHAIRFHPTPLRALPVPHRCPNALAVSRL